MCSVFVEDSISLEMIVCIQKFLLCLLLISIKFSKVTADDQQTKVQILCTKSDNQKWEKVGKLNTCVARKDTKIDSPNSYIDNGDDTINFEALSIQTGSGVRYFPQGFKHSFPRLRVLHIKNGKFTSLTEYDLMQFGIEFELIHIEIGEISILPRNLFRHNPNIKHIIFEKNPLKFIEPGFFENLSVLNNLVRVDLIDCNCINEKFESKSGRGIKIDILNYGSCTERPPTIDLFELTERNRRISPKMSYNLISAMKILSKISFPQKAKQSLEQIVGIEKFNCSHYSDYGESHCRANVEEEQTMIESFDFNGAAQENARKRTQKLVIVDSLMMFIPYNLGDLLPNLKQLVIESTGLSRINKNLVGINLELLDLSNNILTDIQPDTFNSLINLRILDLSSNSLITIDSSLLKPLVNLKLLYLDGNKLLTISPNLLDVLPIDIQVLDLSRNDCIDMAYPYTGNKVSIATGLVDICL